eukprot:2715354-Prymnesium_polylepis.1
MKTMVSHTDADATVPTKEEIEEILTSRGAFADSTRQVVIDAGGAQDEAAHNRAKATVDDAWRKAQVRADRCWVASPNEHPNLIRQVACDADETCGWACPARQVSIMTIPVGTDGRCEQD